MSNEGMPTKGPDSQKIEKLINVLKRFPEGIWIRELARKAGISKSTVNLYINTHLAHKIENVFNVKGKLIRFVRLKK